MDLSPQDRETLQRLEEELWREETRFDRKRMRELLAEDFVEFGRSGRIYSREEIMGGQRQPIRAVLPLPDFQARLLAPNVAQVTYNSAVTYDGVVLRGRRSSIWSRESGSWRLRFHQGTPYEGGS